MDDKLQKLSDILERLELTKKDRKDLEYYIQDEHSFETISNEEIDLISNEVFGINSDSGSEIDFIGEI